MQETVVDEIVAAFVAERLHRGPSAVRTACIVCICGYVGFAVVDPFVASVPLHVLIAVRLLAIAAIGCIFAATFAPRSHYMAEFLSSALFGVVCGGIIVLTVLVGGGNSRYHDPLALTFVGYAVFLPTSLWVAVPMIVTAIVTYDALLIGLHLTGPVATFFTNNAVLLLAGFTASVLVLVTNRSRMREFRLKYELSTAHEGLKALDLAKSNFFANVSHELRTPLTLILATIESIDEEIPPEDEAERHRLDLCRRSSLRLLCLVDDLLELSRLDSAVMRLRVAEVDLGRLGRQLVEQVMPLAQRKEIQLVCEPAGVTLVQADETQLERVLLNLLANAVKFTPPRGTIRLDVVPENDCVAMRVDDNGDGIPEEAIPFIFDRFYQARRSSDSGQRSGVGIGLSLCKKIVELHKGTIGVRSALGKGTCITVKIPLKAAFDEDAVERRNEPAAGEKETVVQERRSQSGLSEWDRAMRETTEYKLWRLEEATERRSVPRVPGTRPQLPGILVVDDNRDIVDLVTGILHGEFVIYTAPDGQQGLEMARAHHPDLIVSDLMMPGLSGFEFLTALRHDSVLRDVPFILLTARGQIEDRINASKLDADAYMAKPFHPVELRTAVRRLLHRQRSQAEAMIDHRSAALRVMAEGIAHDILNPLGFVRGSLTILGQLIKEATALAPAGVPRVAEIQSEAEMFYKSGDEGVSRVQAAIAELRHFSRGDSSDLLPGNVNEAIERAVTVASVRSSVETRIEPTFPVALRPGQLEQVLLNLIINAQQAAGKAAHIEIRAHNDAEHRGVVVAVQDNGPGMDKQTLTRVFDPYFTTKPMGTGLGLSVSRQIIRDHGGTLSVESVPQQGTTFTIWLPPAGAS